MSVTQEPVLFVNSTPDDEYPLRILRAYRENCNVRWSVDGKDDGVFIDDKLCHIMNQHCEQRAEILDKAIMTLEQYQERVNLEKLDADPDSQR